MIVYRITGKKFSSNLIGTGAALFPGRWNKKGTPVLYTGESKEIALLENIVHTPPMLIPDLDILKIKILDDSITEIRISELPTNWHDYPAPVILAEIGEKWIIKNKIKLFVTNPPFMGKRDMDTTLKNYLLANYPESKGDLCVSFIQRTIQLMNEKDVLGVVSQNNWMYLSSLKEFRNKIL